MNLPGFNVCDFKAVGDGITKDTKALQDTIDFCAKSGGGTVIIPAGLYLTGTIYLKSNIELHLSPGATILASPDREDYNRDDVFPENGVFKRENVTGAHLIIAYKKKNISITGTGVIRGNAQAFFDDYKDTGSYRYKEGNFRVTSWRPGQMVILCRCENIHVSDVCFNNSTYWNLFLLGCIDVHINGINITNPPKTPNGDGIDIDCCKNVTVDNCIIRSGDDCVTLRANKKILGEHALPCENITVSNCILSTPCNAIRIGVGDGEIKGCLFINNIIKDTRTAVNIISCYSDRIGSVIIRNILLSNFLIDSIIPFSINLGNSAKQPASIRDISFNRFNIKASAGGQITGISDIPIYNINFSNFNWKIYGGSDNCTFSQNVPNKISHFGYPGINNSPALPCALYMQHTRRVSLNNINIQWEKISNVWNYGLFIRQSFNVNLNDINLRQPKENTGFAIRCDSVEGITLKYCKAESKTNTFLKVQNSPKDSYVRCMGNDFKNAKKAIDSDVDVDNVNNIL